MLKSRQYFGIMYVNQQCNGFVCVCVYVCMCVCANGGTIEGSFNTQITQIARESTDDPPRATFALHSSVVSLMLAH